MASERKVGAGEDVFAKFVCEALEGECGSASLSAELEDSELRRESSDSSMRDMEWDGVSFCAPADRGRADRRRRRSERVFRGEDGFGAGIVGNSLYPPVCADGLDCLLALLSCDFRAAAGSNALERYRGDVSGLSAEERRVVEGLGFHGHSGVVEMARRWICRSRKGRAYFLEGVPGETVVMTVVRDSLVQFGRGRKLEMDKVLRVLETVFWERLERMARIGVAAGGEWREYGKRLQRENVERLCEAQPWLWVYDGCVGVDRRLRGLDRLRTRIIDMETAPLWSKHLCTFARTPSQIMPAFSDSFPILERKLKTHTRNLDPNYRPQAWMAIGRKLASLGTHKNMTEEEAANFLFRARTVEKAQLRAILLGEPSFTALLASPSLIVAANIHGVNVSFRYSSFRDGDEEEKKKMDSFRKGDDEEVKKKMDIFREGDDEKEKDEKEDEEEDAPTPKKSKDAPTPKKSNDTSPPKKSAPNRGVLMVGVGKECVGDDAGVFPAPAHGYLFRGVEWLDAKVVLEASSPLDGGRCVEEWSKFTRQVLLTLSRPRQAAGYLPRRGTRGKGTSPISSGSTASQTSSTHPSSRASSTKEGKLVVSESDAESMREAAPMLQLENWVKLRSLRQALIDAGAQLPKEAPIRASSPKDEHPLSTKEAFGGLPDVLERLPQSVVRLARGDRPWLALVGTSGPLHVSLALRTLSVHAQEMAKVNGFELIQSTIPKEDLQLDSPSVAISPKLPISGTSPLHQTPPRSKSPFEEETEKSEDGPPDVFLVGGRYSVPHASCDLVDSPPRPSYELNARVPFVEDETHEFKAALGPSTAVARAIPRVAPRYIVSFLNGRGGTLYFGIGNDGRVQGVSLPRTEADLVNTALDRVRHERIGPPGSWLFVGHPVLLPVVAPLGDKWAILPDVYVVEIPVYPSHNPSNLHYEIHATSRGGRSIRDRVFWMRHAASTRRLTRPQEMAEWGFHRGRALALALASSSGAVSTSSLAAPSVSSPSEDNLTSSSTTHVPLRPPPIAPPMRKHSPESTPAEPSPRAVWDDAAAPRFEEVTVELAPEATITVEGPGSGRRHAVGPDGEAASVLSVKLSQVPIRNGVSYLVTAVRRGSVLDVLNMVAPGALLLEVNGSLLERERGERARRLLAPGKPRRLLFFTPVRPQQPRLPPEDAPPVVAGRGGAVIVSRDQHRRKIPPGHDLGYGPSGARVPGKPRLTGMGSEGIVVTDAHDRDVRSAARGGPARGSNSWFLFWRGSQSKKKG